MAFVSVPKDLTKVKNKIIFNLTKRQLICLGIAAAVTSESIPLEMEAEELKGIALLDETMQKTRLRYVFNIQDTHKVKGGRTPYLWRLQEKQQEELLNHLEEVYGLEAKDTGSLSDALMATAKIWMNTWMV